MNMNKIIFIALALLSAPLFVIGQQSKTYDLGNFERIAFYGRYTVEVHHSESDTKELELTLHDSELDFADLSMKYNDEELKVKFSGSLIDDQDLLMILRVPKIQHVEARQGCELRFDQSFSFDHHPIELIVDSGGKIKASNINSPFVKTSITKGGSIRVTGKTELLDASIRTGGTIGAAQLKAKKVNASVTMGGEVICFPQEKLDAKVTTGGTISYKGDPTVDKKTRLGGTIEKL